MIGADTLYSSTAAVGGGFFTGILIGYALKKIVKVVAVAVGLFFVGVAYLQYHQIIDIKWAKFQVVSQNAFTTLANATTQIPGFNSGNNTTAFAFSNLVIPLTGSMSMGFAIGFMKG
ncbi:MAG TPA: FUN14 domain-containing protein [Candidatus Nitrosopolaris sp.]|nr:FUN14 domain-containing protein [Candidatus Nitrosopolaris sp.]